MKDYNCQRRHFSLGYRSLMEYLVSKGFIPETLAVRARSSSVSGAEAQVNIETLVGNRQDL